MWKVKVWCSMCIVSLLLVGCKDSYVGDTLYGTKYAVTQDAIDESILATSDAKKTEFAKDALNKPTKKPGDVLSSSSCTEYDPPFEIVFIVGTADVYGGVETPTERVKGTITGGAGGIEARCGAYYRLRGVDWWGFVKVSDTRR